MFFFNYSARKRDVVFDLKFDFEGLRYSDERRGKSFRSRSVTAFTWSLMLLILTKTYFTKADYLIKKRTNERNERNCLKRKCEPYANLIDIWEKHSKIYQLILQSDY